MSKNINFLTDNIVIGNYRRGGGGKFIFNCLGLSEQFTLQSASLAQEQLNRNFSTVEKYDFLMSKLNKVKHQWNDLDLGCEQLFGITVLDEFYLDIPQSIPFNKIIATLSHGNLKFCLIAHRVALLQKQLVIWPNAQVLMFENEDKFIQCYRPKFRYSPRLLNYWYQVQQSNPDKHLPIYPPRCQSEFDSIDAQFQEFLLDYNNGEIFKFFYDEKVQAQVTERDYEIKNQIKASGQAITWNCDDFMESDKFLIAIKHLYEHFELTDFNQELILGYYQRWISTITRV